MKECTHTKGIGDQKEYLYRLKAEEISGSFQMALAIQKKAESIEHNAHPGADPQVIPFPHMPPKENEAQDLIVRTLQIGMGCYFHQGTEEIKPVVREYHAVQHGLINGGSHQIDQHRQEIQNAVNGDHAQPFAGAHSAEHRQAKEEYKLQQAGYLPNQSHPGVLPHQAGRKSAAHHRGNQCEQKTAGKACKEPALPSHGHGMQAIAQAAVKQVAKEARCYDQGIAAMEDCHRSHQIHNLPGIPSGFLSPQSQHAQNFRHGVQNPDRRKPTEILLKDMDIKEGYS